MEWITSLIGVVRNLTTPMMWAACFVAGYLAMVPECQPCLRSHQESAQRDPRSNSRAAGRDCRTGRRAAGEGDRSRAAPDFPRRRGTAATGPRSGDSGRRFDVARPTAMTGSMPLGIAGKGAKAREPSAGCGFRLPGPCRRFFSPEGGLDCPEEPNARRADRPMHRNCIGTALKRRRAYITRRLCDAGSGRNGEIAAVAEEQRRNSEIGSAGAAN